MGLWSEESENLYVLNVRGELANFFSERSPKLAKFVFKKISCMPFWNCIVYFKDFHVCLKRFLCVALLLWVHHPGHRAQASTVIASCPSHGKSHLIINDLSLDEWFRSLSQINNRNMWQPWTWNIVCHSKGPSVARRTIFSAYCADEICEWFSQAVKFSNCARKSIY